jgi:hypothetical protein
MATTDLCFTPATELQRLFRARKTSPAEVMEAVLARIRTVNPTLNAYVTLAEESALEAARRATAALERRVTLATASRRPRVHQGPHAHQGPSHDVGLQDLLLILPTASH